MFLLGVRVLEQNLYTVKSNIATAALVSKRAPEDITIVAVTKTVGIVEIKTAISLGLRDFGENKAQSLIAKKDTFPEAKWHFIGRLQTNKVKDVVGSVSLIHSLDRWPLALALDSRGQALGVDVNALLQINIAGESQKAGIAPTEIRDFFESMAAMKSLKIVGFMTIAPIVADEEEARPIFRKLAELYRLYKKSIYANVNLKHLSMGMSQDYKVAIEEGADIIRIGSVLFS